MDTASQVQSLPGDYYGTVYKGPFIVPILVMVILAISLWWFLRKRKSL